MDKKLLEDVLNYLAPHIKYTMSFIVEGRKDKMDLLKQRIIEGSKKGYVIFSEDGKLDIDFKKLEAEKNKEWIILLKKQMIYLVEMIDKFR